jgi:hypothetical protein
MLSNNCLRLGLFEANTIFLPSRFVNIIFHLLQQMYA